VSDRFHCITCGDDGEPMRVLRIDAARELALCVDDDGEHHTVEIGLVDAAVGTEVLVHAGVALVTVP
jgi:hydrogenase maturation factor